MKLAILGTRGIPANYGGFETFAEELSKRLVARGHEVTVYCRSHHVDAGLKEFNGVKLVVLPTIKHKYLDTVVHTLLSAASAATKRFDAVLVCNAANSPLVPILTWTGTPAAVNVDGLERKRKKWNWLGRAYYRLGERASVWFASEVVTDANAIKEYYLAMYGKPSTMIAYGADVERKTDASAIEKFAVQPEKYFLYVSRLEPENNAAMVIEAYRKIDTDIKLVIVGDAPYADEYKQKLKKLANDDDRIVFTGFVFGQDYRSLQQNAYAYIHATEVGGTHPALIEAMGFGNCVVCLSTVENREVAGYAALFFENTDQLEERFKLLAGDASIVEDHRRQARERAAEKYNWEDVTDEYERLFRSLAKPHV
jgi:glycosyltransferase involved in cell wall biosynthesis